MHRRIEPPPEMIKAMLVVITTGAVFSATYTYSSRIEWAGTSSRTYETTVPIEDRLDRAIEAAEELQDRRERTRKEMREFVDSFGTRQIGVPMFRHEIAPYRVSPSKDGKRPIIGGAPSIQLYLRPVNPPVTPRASSESVAEELKRLQESPAARPADKRPQAPTKNE